MKQSYQNWKRIGIHYNQNATPEFLQHIVLTFDIVHNEMWLYGCHIVIQCIFRERQKKHCTLFYVFFRIFGHFFCIKKRQMPPKRYNDITLAVPTIVPLHWMQKYLTLLDSIFVRLVWPRPCSLCILISMAWIQILVKNTSWT